MYKIITGMSSQYYNEIGKHMITSWLEYWPTDFKLVVYTEDKDTLPITDPRISIVSLDTMGQEYKDFQNSKMKLERRIKTFAKKAWPIMKNLESQNGRLIWIDADVLTEDYITKEWLDRLLDDDSFSCHIGVPQGTYYSVETGFFIINLNHAHKEKFLDEYRRVYYEKDFTNLHKPFDGDIFGKVIRLLREDKKFKYTELSNDPDNGLSPFNNIFKSKMKHYKAKRKNIFKNEE